MLDKVVLSINVILLMRKACVLLAYSVFSSSASAYTLVFIETNVGDIPLRLFDDQAPQTVDNFLGYVNRGDYENVIFHRLVTGFVLQTGGYRVTEPLEVSLVEAIATQAPVQNEPGISNTRGTIAMAKLGGDPDSATSQWFVNLADNSANLDAQNGGFTVFGEVTDMTTVDEITSQPVVNAGGSAFTTLPLTDGVDPIERDEFIRITGVSIVPEPSTAVILAFVSGFGLIQRRR